MTHIHLTDFEAKNIDQITMLVRPIDLLEGCSDIELCTVDKNQPLSEHGFGVLYREPRHKWMAEDKPCHDFKRCPYTIGQTVGLKESWGVGTRPNPFTGWTDGIEYKSDCKFLDGNDDLPIYEVKHDLSEYKQGWHSSITMPAWAIRHHRIISGIKVKRANELTEKDFLRMGVIYAEHTKAFYRHWQSRYAKTKFAWENNPFCFLYELKKG